MRKEKKKELYPLYKAEPPFMDFVGGYGFQGVILQDKKTGKIQCHICGNLFKSVARHIQHKHDMNVNDYREVTGLNKCTPLVCDSTSKKIRSHFIQMSDGERKARLTLLRENNRKVHSGTLYKCRRKIKGRVQYYNRFGTCDLQAKTKFQELYKRLGYIPSTDELGHSLKSIVYERFGSYHKALQLWGVSESEIQEYINNCKQNSVDARRSKNFFPKYEIDIVLNQINGFAKQNRRLPTWEEGRRIGMPSRCVFKRLFGTVVKEKIVNILKAKYAVDL